MHIQLSRGTDAMQGRPEQYWRCCLTLLHVPPLLYGIVAPCNCYVCMQKFQTAWVQALKIPLGAVSLGGTHTLITQPALATHAGMTPEQRKVCIALNLMVWPVCSSTGWLRKLLKRKSVRLCCPALQRLLHSAACSFAMVPAQDSPRTLSGPPVACWHACVMLLLKKCSLVQASRISDGTVRVAVGVEGREDLLNDFKQALKTLS